MLSLLYVNIRNDIGCNELRLPKTTFGMIYAVVIFCLAYDTLACGFYLNKQNWLLTIKLTLMRRNRI